MPYKQKQLPHHFMIIHSLQTKGFTSFSRVFKMAQPFKTWLQTTRIARWIKPPMAKKATGNLRKKVAANSIVLISSSVGIALWYFLFLPFYNSMDNFAYFLISFLLVAIFLEVSRLIWKKLENEHYK